MSEPKPHEDHAGKPPPRSEPPAGEPREALDEMRKRELPSNDWPGKGAG